MTTKPPFGTIPNLLHPQSQNVVADWLFNEGVGSQVWDSFPGRNHGAINGATWVPGGLGFDGDDDYVNIVDSTPLLNPTGALTVVIWLSATVVFVLGGYRCFAAKSDGAGITAGWRFHWDANDPNPRFLVATAGGNKNVIGTTDIDDGTWHCLAGVFDGVSLKIYVDGILEATDTFASTTIVTTSNDLRIGQDNQGARFFQGLVGSMFMYNRALSVAEIMQISFNPYVMFEVPVSPAIFGALIAVVGIVPFRRRIEGY